MDPVIYVIIIFAILALYLIVNAIINKTKENLVYDEIEDFCNTRNYKYNKAHDRRFDLTIESDDFIMYVAVCKIPTNSSVTINSRQTWCLRFGGSRKGRNYPNQRYLNELTPFLGFNPNKSDKKIYKVVVFYPTTEVILKYLNESEIGEIKPDNISFGYKAIRYVEFKEKFDDLLIINQKEIMNPRNN